MSFDDTDPMDSFLLILSRFSGKVGRKDLPTATREQDRARQKSGNKGYAKFVNGGWKLTDEGRAYLVEKALL